MLNFRHDLQELVGDLEEFAIQGVEANDIYVTTGENVQIKRICKSSLVRT